MFIKVLSNHTFLESIHPELKYGDKSGCHSNDVKLLTRIFAQYDDPHSWSRGKKNFLLFFLHHTLSLLAVQSFSIP